MLTTIPIEFEAAAAVRRLDVMMATTALARMRGLLARPPLRAGQAMFISPCNLIHTLGMAYAIDVVFVRRDGLVLKVARDVGPRRMRGHWAAASVLELAAGEAERCAIAPGVRLPLGGL